MVAVNKYLGGTGSNPIQAFIVSDHTCSKLNESLHFFFCWENFLTVSIIFFPFLENFQLLAASFFYGDPQNCVITIHSIYTVRNHIL